MSESSTSKCVPESLLLTAREWKDKAKTSYEAKNYKDAIKCYHSCMMYAKAALSPAKQAFCQQMMRGEEVQDVSASKIASDQEANDLIIACHNNLSACILVNPESTEKDFLRALSTHVVKVLEKDPNNVKALLRKGEILLKTRDFENAQAVFDTVLKQQPSTKRRKELCKAGLHERKEKQKQEWAGMFDRNKNPASGTTTSAQNGNGAACDGNPVVPPEIAELFMGSEPGK